MKQTNTISVTTEHDLHTNELKDFNEVYLLLHGYLLDGGYIYKKLKETLPKDALILAPNGPFLVPFKKGEAYLPKFAWYFFDPSLKTFYINYEPAAEYIKTIIDKYNPHKKPVNIIGYSQGGYLSPKVAEAIPEVKRVIGLACVFRNTKFEYRSDVTYHQIHGNNDLAVEMSGALEEWNILKDKGNQGKFIELDEVGHKLNSEFFTALESLL